MFVHFLGNGCIKFGRVLAVFITAHEPGHSFLFFLGQFAQGGTHVFSGAFKSFHPWFHLGLKLQPFLLKFCLGFFKIAVGLFYCFFKAISHLTEGFGFVFGRSEFFHQTLHGSKTFA
ncbi:MAG: hypothetical protein BWY75_02651 [bacterium ADurb.Bin425]|nr:MAG: hypothetical protein BWY75_02651 [bacterium ADurb.Bin425]